MHREERGPGQLGFTQQDFKVCDLCGALNRVRNHECFICGWSGAFHNDPETVREAMRQFEQRYGGMTQTLISEELLPDERSLAGGLSGIIEKIKHFLSGG